jgi:hypothetical protein
VHHREGSRIPAYPFEKISVDNDYMSCKTHLTQTIRPLTQRRILISGRPMNPVCHCLSLASCSPPDLLAQLRFLVRPQLLIHPTPCLPGGIFPCPPCITPAELARSRQRVPARKEAKGSDHATVRGSVKSATWRVQSGDLPEADASNGWCKP